MISYLMKTYQETTQEQDCQRAIGAESVALSLHKALMTSYDGLQRNAQHACLLVLAMILIRFP